LRIDPEGRTTITSTIRGAHVIITPSTVSDFLKCSNTGATFVDNIFDMDTSNMLRDLMDNDPFCAKIIKIWHQLLVGNSRLRNHDKNNIMVEDLEFISCALQGKKINFPLLIFKQIVEVVSLTASRQGMVTCLPYGRFLSYLFLRHGVVRKMHKTGRMDMFEAESLPLLSLEDIDRRVN